MPVYSAADAVRVEIIRKSMSAMPAAAVERKTSYLVTGAGGFLGSRVVDALVQTGTADVRALVRSPPSALKIAHLAVERVYGDVTNRAAVDATIGGTDIVIHCASRVENDVGTEATTTCLGARVVAEACAKARVKLVHISSCAVYGIPDRATVDETMPHRPRYKHDRYGLAKIAAEAAIRAICKESGLEAAIIQPTMIYGPESSEWTLEPLRMLTEANIAMPANDSSVCNAVYVDDVVRASLLAASHCSRECPSYLVNGPELEPWIAFLERNAELGTPGRVVAMSTNELQGLEHEQKRSKDLLQTFARISSRNPDFRRELLSTNLGGAAFSLISRFGPAGLMKALRATYSTGAASSGPPEITFASAAELPLKLPPAHFRELARQSHAYSHAKAMREIGYRPLFGLDQAFARIKDWAQWSRLI
jgi:nucleoside-diphosphate-sugar epimerase